MIWYRHWLEMRATALACVGTAILGSLFYVRGLTAPSWSGDPTPPFGPLGNLTDSLSAIQIDLISLHALFTWYATVLMSLVLSGDGLKAISRWTGVGLPGVTQFTLSLPVSRRRLVVTRIVSTYMAGAVALFAIAGTNATAFSFTAHAVPLEELLLASVFATMLLLFWSSMFVLLTVIVGQGWGTGITLIAMVVLGSSAGLYGMTASAARQLEPALILLFAVVLAFVLAGTVVAAASEEV